MFRKDYQPTGFAFPTVKRLVMFSTAVLAFILASARPLSASQSETWILIDISEASLSVMQGERIRHNFPNISIGRGGTSSEKTIALCESEYRKNYPELLESACARPQMASAP